MHAGADWFTLGCTGSAHRMLYFSTVFVNILHKSAGNFCNLPYIFRADFKIRYNTGRLSGYRNLLAEHIQGASELRIISRAALLCCIEVHGVMKRRERSGDLSALDDEALMVQVAAGNSHALELLYERYARVVYGLALRMLANAELSEDVVQETFWRVWRRGATFRVGHSQFTSWLFGIAHNLCIDELRRQRSRPTPVYDNADNPLLHALPDTGEDVDTLTWQAEQRRLIVDALRQLPADQREAIELAYFRGLSQREVAEHLGDPLGTVKTRIRLGLQKIRQLLQNQGIGQDDR